MEKVSIGVGWGPLPCKPKRHIETSYSKHVGLFIGLHCLFWEVVPRVAQMQEPN